MKQLDDSKYCDMDARQLVKALKSNAMPGSPVHEEIKGALNAVLIDSLVTSIERHQNAEAKLSRQLLILNIILGVFTVAGTVFALISFI